MVILSGSNIGSSPQSVSLPSPARGSPAGLSPNKSTSGITPELSGLERMLQGWRRQAAKKAEQFKQRELDSEGRRQKEQTEINELRLKIIESRMKKIEQQQQSASKNARHTGSVISDGLELSRKRRSDDEFYLGTPSDGGFSCDSPDIAAAESAQCAPKNVKLTISNDVKPLPVEKNASVFIETFQLPPPTPLLQYANKRPNNARSYPQVPVPASPVVATNRSTSRHSFGYHSVASTQLSATMTHGQSSCTSASQRVGSYAPANSSTSTSISSLRGQVGDVALPEHIEEELIRSLPVDLDAALTSDYMQALDDLEWTPPSINNHRSVNSQQAKPSMSTNVTVTSPALPISYASASNAIEHTSQMRSAMPQPIYSMQQQYQTPHQQPMSRHQPSNQQSNYYHNMVNHSVALGGWHQTTVPSTYANSFGVNGQNVMQMNQQMSHSNAWPQQGMLGNSSAGLPHRF